MDPTPSPDLKMKTCDTLIELINGSEVKRSKKPPFRPAQDDTKPVLRDPILISDPIETEEAVIRLPPFPVTLSKPN